MAIDLMVVGDLLEVGKMLPQLSRSNAFQQLLWSVVDPRLADLTGGCRFASDPLRDAAEHPVVYLGCKERRQDAKYDCA
jgi:hypothetical protein